MAQVVANRRRPVGAALAAVLAVASVLAAAAPVAAEDPVEDAPPTAAPASTPPSEPPLPSPVESSVPSPDPSVEPSPSVDPSPAPSPTPTPVPWTGRLNLFRSTAWVRQYTNYTCTAASVQQMVNLIRGRSNRTLELQLRIIRYERAHDSLTYSQGSDPKGWAAALTYYSGVRYEWKAFDSRAGALRYAARRMLATRKPVGLLVWHGGHAWTMTGFTSATDPRVDSRAVITGIWVAPPLVGTDPRPNTYIHTGDLVDFGRYWERDGLLAWVGHWVVVTPR